MVHRYKALIIFLSIIVVSIICLAQLHRTKIILQSQASYMLEVQLPQLESINKTQQALNALHSLYLKRLQKDSHQRRNKTNSTCAVIDALIAATMNNYLNNPLNEVLYSHSRELSELQTAMDAEAMINRQGVFHAIELITQLQNTLTLLSDSTKAELEQRNNSTVNSALLFISIAELISLSLFIAAFFLAFTLSRPSK